jgi:hypothetical protein
MTVFPMIFVIPPDRLALLKEFVARLVKVQLSENNHAFLHPDSVQGIAEQVAETYHLEFADAKTIVVAVSAEAALPLVALAA